MANPAYSILVVETFNTDTESLSRQTYLFTEASDAKAAYNSEASDVIPDVEKRVFLFEQPSPTRYKRNDLVPFPVNVDTWD